MKKVFNYIIIFVCTLMILFSALVVSSMIPRSAIEENLRESAEFYKTRAGIYRIKSKRIYSYVHYFADTRKMNIINYIDSEKPIESTLWARYYQTIKADTNQQFIDAVEGDEEPTTNYLRYWNGCMLFLRPMLTVFNMEQIYLINQIMLSVLAVVLLIMLFKKSKRLAIIFLLALILVAVWYASMYIEASVMLYVMGIASIITIIINNNKKNIPKEKVDSRLLKLFLITGMVTTFFDFLTTELLTIFMPLLFLLIIRKEENQLGSLKDTLIFLLKACVLWLIGYAGMWLAKWVLASLILHINAFEYVKDEVLNRVNGLQGMKSHKVLYAGVIPKNIFGIPLLYIIKAKFYKWETKYILAVLIIPILCLIDWKGMKNRKYLLILLFIGMIPYVRYLVLANHSYRHAMFTFRDQIITIVVVLYIIADCLNYKLMVKKITKKNKNKE